MKRFLLLILLVGIGCSSEPDTPVASESEIGTPPSIQENRFVGKRIILTDRQRDELNIQTKSVKSSTVSFPIAIPGEVDPSPEHFADISAPISGRVVSISAHEGESVTKGQVLLELESLDFANLVAEYLETQAELKFTQSELNRLTQLVDKGISPDRVLEKAQAEVSRAETRLSASYARLRAVGVTDNTMSTWSTSARERPLLPIIAPISGMVDRHEIDMGSAVEENQSMLTLLDPKFVLIRGFASPDDAALMRINSPVVIRARQASSVQIEASITTLNPAVDEDSRSVVVNILSPTRNGWPRPGESVQVMVTAQSEVPVISIPLSAVQYDGEQAIAFVAHDANTFEPRPIQISRMTADTVFVSEGLEEGEHVAIDQVFTLKALSRFDLYGEE